MGTAARVGGGMQAHPRVGPETRGRTIGWARAYDVLSWLVLGGRARRVRAQLVALADIHPGDAVLDVGCGTGALALVAATQVGANGRVAALDASPAMVEAVGRKAVRRDLRVEARVGVAERLPYDIGSFSAVTCALMIHHLPVDLRPVAFAEMARVLRPDGRLVVADISPGAHGRLAGVVRRLVGRHASGTDGQRLRALAGGAGFDDVQTGRTVHPWLGYVRARKPRLGQVT